MNRQQAKEMLPIIQAFAEGKTILVKASDGLWYGREGENCEFNFNADPQVYRIKSEPKYHQFTNAEECWEEMQKHQPFGWLKSKTDKNYSFILEVDEDSCHFVGDESWSFADLLETETFADGTPFGIKE